MDKAGELALLLGSFLLGSIPFGLFVARVFDVKDLTSRGSGNIGATNVSRVVGFWPAGFMTFLLDFLKGVIPTFLLGFEPFLSLISGWMGVSAQPVPALVWAGGFFTVLGHCYSPWLRFRGGKGVATGFGVLLVLSPEAALFGIAAFGLTFAVKKVGSLSSICGLLTAMVAHLVLDTTGIQLWWGAAIVLLILLRHEVNINALLEERETSFR